MFKHNKGCKVTTNYKEIRRKGKIHHNLQRSKYKHEEKHNKGDTKRAKVIRNDSAHMWLHHTYSIFKETENSYKVPTNGPIVVMHFFSSVNAGMAGMEEVNKNS